MGGLRHVPAALPPEPDTVPIVQEAVWVPGPVWTGAENLAHTKIFFFWSPALVLSLYFFRTYFLCWLSLIAPLLFTVQHTTQTPIRTRNASSRAVTNPRLRPFGHWDRLEFDPQTIRRVASRSTTPATLQKCVNSTRSF